MVSAAGAALYNAALKCNGLISDGDTKLVCDKSKLSRAVQLYGAKQKERSQEKIESGEGISCIGSDGKKDKKTRTKEIEIINGEAKEKFAIKLKEHIVYTREPPGEYLTHSEVESGTGRDLATDFMEVLAES